ncbi:hypothetical protein UFOVP434_66 [uncultured Caudovirales phage]|uniref:Uncharacterized protein n=1 Tax=uncultured Caudovirales phage TaxID=2100421 RepID=A0A6J5M8N3_9CAUD|nr:hypothetical protein UFOVP434_66 [uncultured Caudovirales phage]
MASFSINLINNGSGTYTPTVLRNPSAASSGGTALTIPWVMNNLNGASTTTPLLGTAIWSGFNAIFNALSSVEVSRFQDLFINIIDDGAQNYSVNARYGGTLASGGTALTIPWVVNTMSGASTTSDVESALLRVCTDAITNSTSTTGV